jgi:hypothetical protein
VPRGGWTSLRNVYNTTVISGDEYRPTGYPQNIVDIIITGIDIFSQLRQRILSISPFYY